LICHKNNSLILLPEEVHQLAKFLIHPSLRKKDFIFEINSRHLTSRPTFGNFTEISLIENTKKKSLLLNKEEISIFLFEFSKVYSKIIKYECN